MAHSLKGNDSNSVDLASATASVCICMYIDLENKNMSGFSSSLFKPICSECWDNQFSLFINWLTGIVVIKHDKVKRDLESKMDQIKKSEI